MPLAPGPGCFSQPLVRLRTEAQGGRIAMAKTDIPTTYDPKQMEERIYQFWLDGGYFHA